MTQINIRNEFDEMRTAICHDASNVVDMSMEQWRQVVGSKKLQAHPETGPVDRELFIGQHKRFRDLLEDRGVELLVPDTQPGAVCQAFARDPSFAIGNTMFIGSMREPYRNPEIHGLSSIVQDIGRVVSLGKGGGVIEGGDVMLLDNGSVVLIGTGQTTNNLGYNELRRYLELMGVERVQRIPHNAVHLDCCLAPLPNGEALYSSENLPEDSQRKLEPFFKRMIPLDKTESEILLAANILWLNPQEVVSSVAARTTNGYLRQRGYAIHELEFTEPIHMWGGFRCAVCPVLRVSS